MQYGKISIQDGQLIFKKHRIDNALPCCDILWAYRRREYEQMEEGKGQSDYAVQNSVIVVTRRGKHYKFEMTESEAIVCLDHLRRENPETAIGYPRGKRLPLVSLDNTRDLGAIRTQSGKYILPRKLLRSGELYHVSKQDQQVLLQDYNLRTVIDFRTELERRTKPDTYMEGVRYIRLPILDEEGFAEEESFPDILEGIRSQGEKQMEEQYVSIVLDPYCTDQYAKFFDCLLDHKEGAALWHGSEGKDRVGIGTALLLCALGVPKNVILADFMRSNSFLAQELIYFRQHLEARGVHDEELLEGVRIFFQVQKSYLTCAFEKIEKEYGTIEWYLRKRMYLTPKALEELQRKYLVKL